MSEHDYREALKRGKKAQQEFMQLGEDPYLPVLEELLTPEQLLVGQNVGLMNIPAERIVGTRMGARANSFAVNFMPLMDEKTEFAMKWRQLCEAQMEEGIRDPVKVYEYKNRFYVQEGNKRVSVLKYCGAVTISAEVIRILPERDGSPETEAYFEYLDFVQQTNINVLEFAKPGSYAAFQKLAGKQPKQLWTEEERRHFMSFYYYFGKACAAVDPDANVSEALLAAMKIYGYEALSDMGETKLKQLLKKAKEEVQLSQEEDPLDVRPVPADEKKPGILERILPVLEPKERGVAFVHDKLPEHSGWTRVHELGRDHVSRTLAEKIATQAYFCQGAENAAAAIEQAIADGNDIIFTTSPVLLRASLRAAVEHPKVTILNCSLGAPHRYIRTYYARMYEAKFISGAAAGVLCRDGKVGYICDYPTFGQIAGINAFALGLSMTNPSAKVMLEWTGVTSIDQAEQRLWEKGVRLISSLEVTKFSEKQGSGAGLYRLNEQRERRLLGCPVWNWGVYYEGMLRRILDGTFQAEYAESKKALNYFWGMSAGVIGMNHVEGVPGGIRKLVDLLEKGIIAGTCEPFSGPITAQDGKVICKAGESLDYEKIISMDWLAENIEGAIPKYAELSCAGKALVDMIGVNKAQENEDDAL